MTPARGGIATSPEVRRDGGDSGKLTGRTLDQRSWAAGIVASARAGRVRVGFHLYNTAEDVERLLSALR